MDLKSYFSIAAGVLSIGCFVPYIASIFKDKTKPMKATWFIWASLDSITVVGMYLEDTVNGQIAGAAIGTWIVFCLSLRYGVKGWTHLDKFCLAALAVSILLIVFGSNLLGIITSCLANCIGSLPTIRSTWEDSRRENKTAWVMGAMSSLCAFASIPDWTLGYYAQPVAFLSIQLVILYLLFFRAAIPVAAQNA